MRWVEKLFRYAVGAALLVIIVVNAKDAGLITETASHYVAFIGGFILAVIDWRIYGY